MRARRTETLARKRGRSHRDAGPARRRGAGAGRSPAPAPLLAIAIAIAVVAAVVIVVIVARADGGSDLERRTAELEAQEAARHAAQVADLTEAALAVHGRLLPVLAGLHTALPTDGTPAVPADATLLASWQEAVAAARIDFGDPPSGSTELNTTRGGLVLAVDLLSATLLAYESALAAAGADRERLERLAVDLRRNAVDAWAVAATGLDLLNIEINDRHVHLYLPIRPGEDVSDPHGHD